MADILKNSIIGKLYNLVMNIIKSLKDTALDMKNKA